MDQEHQDHLVRQNIIAGYGYSAVEANKPDREWNPQKLSPKELPTYLKTDPVLWRFFQRLHYEDKNFLCVVVGETGSGKSCTAISLARALDITPLGKGMFKRNFIVEEDGKGVPTPQTRVVFGASQFIKLIKSGLPKGSIIVWDEAGVSNDSQTWYDKKSQIIKHIMQTFRSRNYGVFMTVPDKESIAKQTRRLVHCYIDVRDRTPTHAKTTVNWIQRVRGREETEYYYKTPAFVDPSTGQIKKVSEYRIPKLDPSIEKVYNKIKDTTLQNMYEFYQREMDFMDKELGYKQSLEAQLTEAKLKKFNLPFAVDLCSKNYEEVIDEMGSLSKAKIQLFLNKRGFECNSTQAKTITEVLPPPPIDIDSAPVSV